MGKIGQEEEPAVINDEEEKKSEWEILSSSDDDNNNPTKEDDVYEKVKDPKTIKGWRDQGYSDLFQNGPAVQNHYCNHFPITPVQICTCPPQQKMVEEGAASVSSTLVYNPFTKKVVDVYSILRNLFPNQSTTPEEAYALGRQIHWGGFSQIHVATVLVPLEKEHDDVEYIHDDDVKWKVTDRQVAIKIISRDSSSSTTDDEGAFDKEIKDMSSSSSREGSSKKDIFEPLDEVSAIHILSQKYHDEGNNTDNNNHVIRSIVTFVDCVPQYNWIFMVMPLCHGGELLEYVASQTQLVEDEVRCLFIQILQGVSQFHRLGLVHLDLSLENVLLEHKLDKHNKDQTPRLVIIDFGACMLLPTNTDFDPTLLLDENNQVTSSNHTDSEEEFHDASSSFSLPIDTKEVGNRLLLKPVKEGGREHIGKLQYTCPEVLEGDQPWDGFAVDLWSCGIMLFTMLIGRGPWRIAQEKDFYFSVVQKEGFEKLFSLWGLAPHQYPSKEALNLLQCMLHKDPHQRLTRWNDIQSHPWLQGKLILDNNH